MMHFLAVSLAIFRGLCPNQIINLFHNKPTESNQAIAAYKYEYRRLVRVPVWTTEDYLSRLPDELLLAILSHLTLRDALRMTILSTRWKDLRLPYLDLDWRVISGSRVQLHLNDCMQYEQKFIERVDQVLRVYKDINITKFRLSFCYSERYSKDVDKWINFAADKSLESLTLEFFCGDDKPSLSAIKSDELYVICTSFLTRFRNLRILRLDYCIFKISDYFRLDGLVKLDLNHVVLDRAQLQCCLSRSDTSSIEWLRLRNCNLPEKLCIGNNFRSLKFLMIDTCPDVQQVEIFSRNLKTLEFVGKVAMEFSSIYAPSLEKMSVCLTGMGSNDAVYMLETFARHFSSNVALILGGTYSTLYQIPSLPSRPGTSFNSILQLDFYLYEEYSKMEVLSFLPSLLQAFSSLQKLSMQLPSLLFCNLRHRIPKEISKIDSFHMNLKEVELGGFEFAWMFFADYLLRSCLILEKMVINSVRKRYVGCGSSKCNRKQFTPNEFKRISVALQQKAVSRNALLIICDVCSGYDLYDCK